MPCLGSETESVSINAVRTAAAVAAGAAARLLLQKAFPISPSNRSNTSSDSGGTAVKYAAWARRSSTGQDPNTRPVRAEAAASARRTLRVAAPSGTKRKSITGLVAESNGNRECLVDWTLAVPQKASRERADARMTIHLIEPCGKSDGLYRIGSWLPGYVRDVRMPSPRTRADRLREGRLIAMSRRRECPDVGRPCETGRVRSGRLCGVLAAMCSEGDRATFRNGVHREYSCRRLPQPRGQRCLRRLRLPADSGGR